jgi:hypothetical protein
VHGRWFGFQEPLDWGLYGSIPPLTSGSTQPRTCCRSSCCVSVDESCRLCLKTSTSAAPKGSLHLSASTCTCPKHRMEG